MNKTKELLEVIEGFQNLTARIKDDNDSIKSILKKKDLIINECKIEYRRLTAEHEQLKKNMRNWNPKLKKMKKMKIKKLKEKGKIIMIIGKRKKY